MRAALTCGTDVKILKRGHSRVALPVTMGHEMCGEVAEVGEGVAGWRVGDRAVPGVSGPCGRCAECSGGRANLCSAGPADWMWGTFAEFVRIPAGVVAANLHRVPEGLSDEVAAFLDPLASVIHGWNRLREPAGSMLVYGAGALAFLWAALAHRHGLEVVVAGRRPERAAMAERYGARFVDVSAGPLEKAARSFDAAVDCTGDPAVWEGAARAGASRRPGASLRRLRAGNHRLVRRRAAALLGDFPDRVVSLHTRGSTRVAAGSLFPRHRPPAPRLRPRPALGAASLPRRPAARRGREVRGQRLTAVAPDVGSLSDLLGTDEHRNIALTAPPELRQLRSRSNGCVVRTVSMRNPRGSSRIATPWRTERRCLGSAEC